MTGDPPSPAHGLLHHLHLQPPDPSKERRSGPLQLLTLAALLAVLFLPLANSAGLWPQHLCLCITAPAGARVATLGGTPVDTPVPAQLRHRIAWRVDGTEWTCPIRIEHPDGVAIGRLRGHNCGGLQNANLAPIEHVESCDGSLWLQPSPRRIEVLPPRDGHCWLACELSDARSITFGGSTAEPAHHWHRALPAQRGEHHLGTDRWSLTMTTHEGTCIQLAEVPADAPFVQVVADDSGFAGAELQRGGEPVVKAAPGERLACGDEPFTVAFADGDGIVTTRLLLRLAAEAGLGLIVRASRPH